MFSHVQPECKLHSTDVVTPSSTLASKHYPPKLCPTETAFTVNETSQNKTFPSVGLFTSKRELLLLSDTLTSYVTHNQPRQPLQLSVWFGHRWLQMLKLGFWWVVLQDRVLALFGFLVYWFFFLKGLDSWPVKCLFSLHLLLVSWITFLTTALTLSKGKTGKEFIKPSELTTCTKYVN